MAKRSAGHPRRRLEEARRLHVGGQVHAAVRLYQELDRDFPDDAGVLHGLGVAMAQLGRLAEADARLSRAVELEPELPDVRFDLAALRDAQGRPAEAERELWRVVEGAPDYERAWEAIAMYRSDAQDLVGAGQAYAQIARLHPDRPELALRAAELLPPEEGATLLALAAARRPDAEELLQPFADLLIRLERFEEAERILNVLRERQPRSATPRRRLGMILAGQNRFPEASAALHEALMREPEDAEGWRALAMARDSMGDPDGAVAALDRALVIEPDSVDLVNLRARLQQNGFRLDEAERQFSALPADVRERAEVRLVHGMLLPPLNDSNEEIDRVRERWMETMADVEARPTPITEPWETVSLNGYYLGYHGREDRSLMEAMCRATLACSPHLAYESPQATGSGERKLRVGFLSAHMRRHSVGRVLVKLMGALDRERFDVVLFQLPDTIGGGQEWGEANADRTVKVPANLEGARAAVESERPDVLIFCEFHLNPFQDALAFSRLAPVQATTWGHPGTSGRGTIDYWLSCEDWEVEGNERLYTERLVRLPLAPYVYAQPAEPALGRDRASFGLREDARYYGILQSMFKFHPDFDAILARILEQDPKGRIVLIDGPNYAWKRRLFARFARSFDPGRVDAIPKVPNRDYLAAVSACDAMLDPIHFAGANTSLEAFAMGKPVVTLRGDQMRNRVTGGFYRQMGYERLIAADADEYAELALRLATDRVFDREARQEILARNGVLFENLAPVKPFEDWLLSVRK